MMNEGSIHTELSPILSEVISNGVDMEELSSDATCYDIASRDSE